MTNIEDLFSGICVIVDDAFGKRESSDNILKIKQSIEGRNIPVIAYPELPAEGHIKHYKDLNFVILDWDINPMEEADQLEGVQLGDASKAAQQDGLISFIKKLNDQAYIPIFIFSQQDIESIKRRLIDEGILVEGKPTNIFIKSKGELLNTEENTNVLFDEIEKWLKETPSVYVLKEWENAAKSAKRDLFWSFNNIHHEWPHALSKAFESDGTDPSHELGALIFKNIIARTTPINFDDGIVKTSSGTIGKDDIRKVLENERYLTNDFIPEKPSAGCLFKIARGGKSPNFDYFLNIRPDCDIARDDDPQLYCLKGKVVNNEGKLIFDKGTFIEKAYFVLMPLVDEGKIIEFDLRELSIKQWSELRQHRIGRILPPYITRIQQKYAFYLHRQGVPGLPENIIFKEDTPKDGEAGHCLTTPSTTPSKFARKSKQDEVLGLKYNSGRAKCALRRIRKRGK